MTFQDLEKARSQSSGKLFKRRLAADADDVTGSDDVTNRGKKRRRKAESSSNAKAMVAIKPVGFTQATNTSDVVRVTSSLKDKVVVVEPSSIKADLERTVAR